MFSEVGKKFTENRWSSWRWKKKVRIDVYQSTKMYSLWLYFHWSIESKRRTQHATPAFTDDNNGKQSSVPWGTIQTKMSTTDVEHQGNDEPNSFVLFQYIFKTDLEIAANNGVIDEMPEWKVK